ncbi:MAG: synthase subunit epsilon [Bacteroidota bacterium]|jgi:F-type H+-transporting ATPase subunit epsilon
MILEILTPEKKFFSGEVESILFPGTDGKFEILKGHAPLISSLKSGEIRVRQNSKDSIITIKDGFVEVMNNKVNVMVEGAQ